MQKEVQNEAMRAEWVSKRLELGGCGGHDIRVLSMVIYDCFEKEYSEGPIVLT